jgi:transcriptional regulator of met regulon
MPEHKKLWNDWLDGYYLELLDGTMNSIPEPPKPFREMSEVDLNLWLSKVNLDQHKRESVKKFKISNPSKQERCLNHQTTKTDVVNLQLSLENNSTLTGTAAILEQFAEEFSIPCPHHYEIPFNKSEKKL